MAISRNGRKNNQHGNELTITTKKKQKTKLRRCCVAVWLAGCDKLSVEIKAGNIWKSDFPAENLTQMSVDN